MDRRTLIFFLLAAIGVSVWLFFRITNEADAAKANQENPAQAPGDAPATDVPKPDAPKPDAPAPAPEKKPEGEKQPAEPEKKPAEGEKKPEAPATPTPPAEGESKKKPAEGEAPKPMGPVIAADPNPDRAPPEAKPEYITLGSIDPESNYRMLVTFTSKGAAVRRVELNSPDYLDIADKPEENYGYFGHLEVESATGSTTVVGIVGPGTPAALAAATPAQPTPGLVAGDEIISAQRLPSGEVTKIDSPRTFGLWERTTLPGESVELKVRRQIAGAPVELTFKIDLVQRPMQVIRPGPFEWVDPLSTPTPVLKSLSYLFHLQRIGPIASSDVDEAEIPGIGSFREGTWQITKRPTDADPTVEFTRKLTARDWRILKKASETKQPGEKKQPEVLNPGDLEVVKRFSLARVTDKSEKDDPNAKLYHLVYEIEIRNLHTAPIQVAYHQSGPTGLPEEGWWYSYKVHPYHFSGAGTRDPIWRSHNKDFTAFLCMEVAEKWKKHRGEEAYTDLVGETDQMQYVGVDAIYFSSALLNGDLDAEKPFDPKQNYTYDRTKARVVGRTYAPKITRSDVTFELTSTIRTIEAGGALKQRFLIFAGPKEPALLTHYDLQDSVVYGWFAWFATLLLAVLHGFHWIVGSYGLSIILLTVLVRVLMFPLSRQMAINQQAMQDLAPEMAKINEKYKDDMMKRSEATQELYAKNGVNPLSGCLFMPLQMPIFIGLYRGLAVDVALRQAPLIPGLAWCSDLAGPDKLWYWQPYLLPLGLGWLVGDDGYLGPYLNVLPLITMVLFLWQSRQFATPAADEQQEMMQNVSTFMMVFMSFLFFKVASGLCLYFIASSVWGIAEKYLIPPKVKSMDLNAPPDDPDKDDARLAQTAAEIEARKARKRKRERELE